MKRYTSLDSTSAITLRIAAAFATGPYAVNWNQDGISAMAIDTVTVSLLGSVLGSAAARNLFTTIANMRIAEVGPLRAVNPDADQELDALQKADLISAAPSGGKYYVTAKGLKVARDLEKIPIG